MLDGRDSYLEAAHELWGTLIKRSGIDHEDGDTVGW